MAAYIKQSTGVAAIMSATQTTAIIALICSIAAAWDSSNHVRATLPCKCPSRTTYTVQGYIQNIVNGTAGSPATAKTVIGSPLMMTGNVFGSLTAIDNKVTQQQDANSPQIGRAKGSYLVDSVNGSSLFLSYTILLNSGPYSGSSFTIGGSSSPSVPERRIVPIVGGTGIFQFAQGTILFDTITFNGLNVVIHFVATPSVLA